MRPSWRSCFLTSLYSEMRRGCYDRYPLSETDRLIMDIMVACSDELLRGCDYCSHARKCARLWDELSPKPSDSSFADSVKQLSKIVSQRRENLELPPALRRMGRVLD